jgi:hypothetical protein
VNGAEKKTEFKGNRLITWRMESVVRQSWRKAQYFKEKVDKTSCSKKIHDA